MPYSESSLSKQLLLQSADPAFVVSTYSGFLDYQVFFSNPGITVYERTPDSLITGLTKIGGLIALFKLGSFLKFYHKR